MGHRLFNRAEAEHARESYVAVEQATLTSCYEVSGQIVVE